MQQDQYSWDSLLTAQEVASLVRVHVRTFQKWCKEGQGPIETRLANVVRFAESDVRRWMGTRKERRDEEVA